jgi:hypothetical protein
MVFGCGFSVVYDYSFHSVCLRQEQEVGLDCDFSIVLRIGYNSLCDSYGGGL